MDPLLSSSMRQASFKCEMPRLELKSSRSFLAIKRWQQTKIGKVIKLARSSLKSWAHICARSCKAVNDKKVVKLFSSSCEHSSRRAASLGWTEGLGQRDQRRWNKGCHVGQWDCHRRAVVQEDVICQRSSRVRREGDIHDSAHQKPFGVWVQALDTSTGGGYGSSIGVFCENPCLSIKEGHCKWLVIRSLDA